MTNFSDFGLSGPIMKGLADAGHNIPTPIQLSAIPLLMSGRDVIGIAQTGTGKTAAFVLPLLHRLSNSPRTLTPGECRVLVLAPTRELATQIHDRFRVYGRHLRLRTALVIGGVSIARQKADVKAGVDVLVATPGRLVDLVNQNAVTLSRVEAFVLDEVDMMLDLGFIHAIRAIAAKLPARRHSVFFSATMPQPIARLADSLLRDPVRAEIAPKERLKIEQSVMHVESGGKPAALVDIVRRDSFTRGLVFTRTKRGADKVVRSLTVAGAPAHAIHGNRSQPQRELALNAFRTGKVKILVATDIAARGLDIAEVSHVVNYDLPNTPETYVHRIGRTARAGAAGVAISFCSVEERDNLHAIEKLTRQRIAVATGGRAPVQARRPESDRQSGARTSEPVLSSLSFLKESGDRQASATTREQQKETSHGEGRTARVRRRRHRGSAGRQLSRASG